MTLVDAWGGTRRALPPFVRGLVFPLTFVGAAVAAGLTLGWLITWLLPSSIFGPASVRCFSNGQLIYDGRSEGAVDRGWTGIAFRDAAGHRTRIRGDCVIIYEQAS